MPIKWLTNTQAIEISQSAEQQILIQFVTAELLST